MKRKRNRTHNRNRPIARDVRTGPAIAETQVAEAVTVAWSLALGANLVSQALGLVARCYLWRIGPDPRVALIGSSLFLIALVSGLATLSLTGPVIRLRRQRLPRHVMAFGVILGVTPWLTLLLLWAAAA